MNNSEEYIIYCILNDNDIATEMFEKLKCTDFDNHILGEIFEYCKIVKNIYNSIDYILLTVYAQKKSNLPRWGGMTRLNELANIDISTANYNAHCDIIKINAYKKNAIKYSNELAKKIDKCVTLEETEKTIKELIKKYLT